MKRLHPVAQLWRRARASLWPLPMVALTAAVALGVLLPRLDAVLGTAGSSSPLSILFGGGPAAARDLLAAISGSLISVTGVTFSLTVVALQLGSSQYSPRLLQTFVTDPVVQATLAQLTATFVYSLTVLRTVRTADETEAGALFVPRVSITLAFLAALGSVAALVGFLGHIARTLRVETMLRDVHDEATQVVRDLGPDTAERSGSLPEGAGSPVESRRSGFVVDVDTDAVVAAAREADVLIAMVPRMGDSVVAGTPLALVWRRTGGPADVPDDVAATVDRAVRLSMERTPDQDATYGLRKIVDIAGRALSPGINDPTTAVHALSHVSAVLGDLLLQPTGYRARRDDAGVDRLLLPRWSADDLLRLGLEEVLQYASGQPAVLRRVAGVLRELAWRVRGSGLDDALRALLDRTARQALETTSIDERETVAWRSAVQDALAGRWSPGR